MHFFSGCAGDVWHVAVQGLPGSGVCYTLRVSGHGGWDTGYRWDKSRLLLDPRAPLVAGRSTWGNREDLEHFEQNVSAILVNLQVVCWQQEKQAGDTGITAAAAGAMRVICNTNLATLNACCHCRTAVCHCVFAEGQHVVGHL